MNRSRLGDGPHPGRLPRVLCPECGKNVAARPRGNGFRPVQHHAPGAEHPFHMGGPYCPGVFQLADNPVEPDA
jgi:hypothetical protein